jgi:hypothetical protein
MWMVRAGKERKREGWRGIEGEGNEWGTLKKLQRWKDNMESFIVWKRFE